MRTLTCLFFILTNSVIAQADFQPQNDGNVELQLQQWIPTYAGETEIDGLPVVVTFEEVKAGTQVPSMVAMAPSLLPVERQSYRLNLTISHRPVVRAIYEVNPSPVSVAGDFRFAYLSVSNDERGFQFAALTEEDGTLLVTYTRQVVSGNPIKGEFRLYPVPHIF